jgi:NADPH-dependent F420 reductase
VRVAIIGGTGSFGGAIARRLAALGEDEVVLGSREGARASARAAELGGRVTGALNAEAVRGADLVVLAVAAGATLETARELAGALGSTPLLSVASALSFAADGVRPDPEALSLAERVQQLVAGPVAAGLHSIAASNLDAAPPAEDALVCGDDGRAKQLSLALAGKLVSGRALDAGPLSSARTLEGLTAVIVNLNRRYKAHAGISVTGLPDA